MLRTTLSRSYGPLRVQEIPAVRENAVSHCVFSVVSSPHLTLTLYFCAQNAELKFDLELLSIKKDNVFGKARA